MNAPAIARMEPPTEAQLRAAWRRIQRNSWPPTYEGAMADPICARLVRMTATAAARALGTVSAARPAPAPIAPARRVFAPAPPPPGYVDHKRAAAGDVDDD